MVAPIGPVGESLTMERRPAADRSWRRRLVTVSLLVVVGSLVSAPGVSADSGPINGPILIPPKGSLFGIAASQSSAAVTSLEATLGRPLDTQRVYSNMSTAEPIAQVRWDVTQGITPSQSAEPQPKYMPVFLNDAECAFINAAVDRLIPADVHGPDGVEAGVPVFIDRQLDMP